MRQYKAARLFNCRGYPRQKKASCPLASKTKTKTKTNSEKSATPKYMESSKKKRMNETTTSTLAYIRFIAIATLCATIL